MNAAKRRERIISYLKSSSMPTSASHLASLLEVSRQIIVSDIALLRAGGVNISATPRGYILSEDGSAKSGHDFEGILACRHTSDQLREELYTIVDFGAEVLDVTIEHSLYGQLSGKLNLSSRYDVDLFLNKIQNNSDLPLSCLTEGIHLHKVGCRDEKTFQLIKKALESKNMLIK
ncbi:transcription repressor NadR [Aminipila luticellarii]|uniref:Transcription repressor NadR n=1 Tax=Aminipila luticellarii TaxID=2507160 RepID=A0A410PT75_9FIRM|nr:transcription repressor NadR [Aminipila luticellarii]QAT42099.1 transcription repressor NadR [Aminipila luticellarii]